MSINAKIEAALQAEFVNNTLGKDYSNHQDEQRAIAITLDLRQQDQPGLVPQETIKDWLRINDGPSGNCHAALILTKDGSLGTSTQQQSATVVYDRLYDITGGPVDMLHPEVTTALTTLVGLIIEEAQQQEIVDLRLNQQSGEIVIGANGVKPAHVREVVI